MQTRYDTNRYTRARGDSRKAADKKARREALMAARLTVCGAVLGVALLLKVFFPGSIVVMKDHLLPRLEQDVDYMAAVTALGETLTGEASFTEVLGDMYVRAFGGAQPKDMAVSAQTPQPASTAPVEPTPAPTPQPTPEPTPEPTPAPTPEPEPEPDEADPVVQMFLDQQAVFAEYELPVSVTYDYTALNVDYILPISAPVSSTFGYRNHPVSGGVKFHYGTDYAANTGEVIGAFAAGTVIEATEDDSWGKYIVIDHGDGVTTRYAHCNALYVSAGDWVSAGQGIGEVGATGNVTGPHLHLELKVNGMYVNPEYYLTGTGG